MDDGLWVPGFIEAYRKVEGVWSGFVRYTLAPDATHLGWFEEGRIRGHSGQDNCRFLGQGGDGVQA